MTWEGSKISPRKEKIRGSGYNCLFLYGLGILPQISF